jgi:hypothetical protein
MSCAHEASSASACYPGAEGGGSTASPPDADPVSSLRPPLDLGRGRAASASMMVKFTTLACRCERAPLPPRAGPPTWSDRGCGS